MDLIGAFKFRIDRVSINDRQKDILSLLYMVWFSIFTIVLINTIATMVINTFGRTIFLLINSLIESIKNNLTPNFEVSNINFFDITDLTTFIKLSIPWLITFIYVKCFENIKYKREVIYIIINILLLIALFWDLKIIILLLFLTILIIIFPLGSGKYYKSFSYFRYVSELRKNEIKVSNKTIFIIITKILFVLTICFGLSVVTSFLLKTSILSNHALLYNCSNADFF